MGSLWFKNISNRFFHMKSSTIFRMYTAFTLVLQGICLSILHEEQVIEETKSHQSVGPEELYARELREYAIYLSSP